jgi:ribosome-binding ATPase YchF (GTP1/OBG family)
LLEDELLLHDMLTVDRRLERLAEERQKGGRDPAEVDREADTFRELAHILESGKPLRADPEIRQQRERLQGFGLLTLKPNLIVINKPEQGERVSPDLFGEAPSVQMCAKLEMEIAQLPEAEAQEFWEEYDIDEPGRERVLRASYKMLNLLSFFTINEQEARAWTLPEGGTAWEAAGTIHSDMARGFIRAEVIAWADLLQLESLAQARAQGRLRIEGKDYRVQDGEVIYIRFNV